MRINKKQLEAYRKTHGREIFCTKERTYDIVIAQFICEKTNKSTGKINVEELASACGFDHRPVKEEDGLLFFLRPDGSKSVIDAAHAMAVTEQDLNKPLILAHDGALLDGMHRLYQAFMYGVEELPAYTLTTEEAKAC